MDRPPDRFTAFIRRLQQVAREENRGALAALRRGVGKPPGSVAEIFPLVLPWLPANLARREEDTCLLIAALFATHPQEGGAGSLGTAFATLARAHSGGQESVERRLVALLNCHVEEFPEHLRHAIALLRSKDVPLDWHALLNDVRHWDHPERFVQRRWAKDFWATRPQPAETPVAAETPVDN